MRRPERADGARDDADERGQQRERPRQAQVALHAPSRSATIAPTKVFRALANSWSSENPARRPKSLMALSEIAPTKPPTAASTAPAAETTERPKAAAGHERRSQRRGRGARPGDGPGRPGRQRAERQRRYRAAPVERPDLGPERVGERGAEGRRERGQRKAEEHQGHGNDAVGDDVRGAAAPLVRLRRPGRGLAPVAELRRRRPEQEEDPEDRVRAPSAGGEDHEARDASGDRAGARRRSAGLP